MIVTLLRKATATVSSYAEASRAVSEDIKRRGVGASRWYGKGAGRILVEGVQVAFVSYNGRVWKGVDDGKMGHDEIVEEL